MWKLFRRSRRVDDSFHSLDRAVEDLATCCSTNAESVQKLGTRIEAMEADISLMWEKTNRALNRFAKRESRDGQDVQQQPGVPNVDEINRRILDGEPLR
jgi:hypothetical protein